MNITQTLSREIDARPQQVDAAIELMDSGATVPFIARYRKEVTGGLDDTQLRLLEERLTYLRTLEERRTAVLASISEQGKLTPALEASIKAADTKTTLEDLYLPYKPKRRTKAQIAREAGLEPLADALLADPNLDPETEAARFLNTEHGFADTAATLDGARQIVMERFTEDAALVGRLREEVWQAGILHSKVAPGKEQEGAKFRDYFDYHEALAKIPSHRALALFRGREEGMLQLETTIGDDPDAGHLRCQSQVASAFGVADQGRAADRWLLDSVRIAWRAKLFSRIDIDLKLRLREAAESEAIKVFARNLKDLLLAAPAGARTTLGLDPGLRTGVKVVVNDATGKLLEHATIYPHAPKNQWDQSIATLAALSKKYGVELVSIGNGTASRETDKLVRDLIKLHPNLKLQSVIVSEAGASVYSASALAAREFPDLDVSLRGAVSIARRLQDPLAELVKIEPKSIGVGQYQHDVNQVQLGRSLEAVVEDCVNGVGVDINTASAPLLAQVAGLGQVLAENVVQHRDLNGPFRNRKALLKVARLGAKAYEQAAGFLRIRDGDNPLDASAVHPEAYPVVKRISAESGKPVEAIIGNRSLLRELNPANFTDERFGLPTVRDIFAELEKPGRDPRPEFRTASFAEGVEELKDLRENMQLEGTVTNVTNFGAFVDIGVHQDGLVHISQLADRFIKDPHQVVKAGDIVRVRVVEVDVARKRIALTMRSEKTDNAEAISKPANTDQRRPKQRPPKQPAAPAGTMADALRDALKR